MGRLIGFIVVENEKGETISYQKVHSGQNIIEEMQAVRDTAKPGTCVFAERLLDNEQTEVIASTGIL